MADLKIEKPIVLGFFVLLVVPIATWAQEPADSFERLRTDLRLLRDDTVRVTDLSGIRIQGRLESVSADSLNVIVDGRPRQIPAPSVRQISRQRPDSVVSGVLIGLGAGFLGGMAAASSCDFWSCGLNWLIGLTIAGPIAGGVIDGLHHGYDTVYELPARSERRDLTISPLLDTEQRGVRVEFSF